MHGSSPAIETKQQSGDCWNWKDNSDLKSEARNVHMGSSPISPIGECNYEETETIIKVATAVQLRQPAGEAQLVEHRTFNPGAASSKLVARIMRLWCIGCTTALQAVGSGSTPDRCFIIPICGGKHTQRTQNASSERNCGFVSHQIDYRHVE